MKKNLFNMFILKISVYILIKFLEYFTKYQFTMYKYNASKSSRKIMLKPFAVYPVSALGSHLIICPKKTETKIIYYYLL